MNMSEAPSWAATNAAKAVHLADPSNATKRHAYNQLLKQCAGECGIIPVFVDRKAT